MLPPGPPPEYSTPYPLSPLQMVEICEVASARHDVEEIAILYYEQQVFGTKTVLARAYEEADIRRIYR